MKTRKVGDDELRVAILEGLLANEKVMFPNLGYLVVRDRAARKARNPQTNAVIDVPASKTVVFKPSAELKSVLAKFNAGLKMVG
jgi:nucleoid DNA-binding protein